MPQFDFDTPIPVPKRMGFLIEYTPESLRMVRKYRKLTQKSLGDLVNSSGDYISELERGKCQPSSDLMGRLAKILEIIFFT